MPISGHLHKIAFGGPLAQTESWSCGLHYLTPDAGVLDIALVRNIIQSWWIATSNSVNGLAQLGFVKANEVSPATDKYLSSGDTNDSTIEPPLDGPYPTDTMPPQNTVAVTLRSSIKRGYGHSGRFYPPTGRTFPGLDGRLTATQMNGYAQHCADLIRDLNVGLGGNVVIYSKIGQVANFVVAIDLGLVVDTQRRRRKSLDENYVNKPVPVS